VEGLAAAVWALSVEATSQPLVLALGCPRGMGEELLLSTRMTGDQEVLDVLRRAGHLAAIGTMVIGTGTETETGIETGTGTGIETGTGTGTMVIGTEIGTETGTETGIETGTDIGTGTVFGAVGAPVIVEIVEEVGVDIMEGEIGDTS